MDHLFHYALVKSGNKGPVKIDILPATFWTEKSRNAVEGGRERSIAFGAIRFFQPFYFSPAVHAHKGNIEWFKRMLIYSTISCQEKAYKSLFQNFCLRLILALIFL